MPLPIDVRFAPLTAPLQKLTAVLVGPDLQLGPVVRDIDKKTGGALLRAARSAEFTAKAKSSFELLGHEAAGVERLLVVGTGGRASDLDRAGLGGAIAGLLMSRNASSASLVVDLTEPFGNGAETVVADLAYGALLRAYRFTRYQTRKAEANGEAENGRTSRDLKELVIHCARPAEAEAEFAGRRAVAEGVVLARDLVNEPPNVLGPVEFADRIASLADHGLEVEILEPEQMAALSMNALLGVAQGSARPARLAILQWHGSRSKRAKPVCFVGKGVTFDTGGISIKPSPGMEDMKGDMGGAAAVVGAMVALAGRKAPVNAVGLVGLVENMPSGSAQRPGDIVTSMSGQTIEVLNTDAEGRLVLADVVWYAQERFKPRMIVDLATLTGAIMVALGKEHAGLFCNDDKLAAELIAAGEATGEKVWRMPMGAAYDKLIDSKTADMKNIGGRFGGAIIGAQFIGRFVKGVPWAHIDIAGTAMDSNRNDINQSWGSGWGVRLLDRLVRDSYEKAEK
ncbi:MAG: leucyl aminopeptidase [Hyphomicrobiales bacterium]|nr:leucyl aminopeptidase [Hyphomicrobiales bacterium]